MNAQKLIAVGIVATLCGDPLMPANADNHALQWARCRGDDAKRQIRACSALIQSHQDSPAALARAFFHRGRALSGKGDFAHAIGDLNQAIALDPEYPDAFNSRGVAFAAAGQTEKAIEDFSRAIAFDPNFAIAIYNRALALQLLGRAEEAAQDFARAKEVGPRVTVPKE